MFWQVEDFGWIIVELLTMSPIVSLPALTAVNNNGTASLIPIPGTISVPDALAIKYGKTPMEKQSTSFKFSHKYS